MKYLARGFWLLLLTTSLCFGAEQVTDEKFGFSFTVPKEPFVSYEVNKESSPNGLYSFRDREATPGNPPTILQVERLRGLIDLRERARVEDIPKQEGTSSSLELFPWGGLKLDLIRQEIRLPDAPVMVAFMLAVPLQEEAVQLLAVGPLNREADVRKALDVFAADFKNLKPLYMRNPEPATSTERAAKMAVGMIKLIITALVVLVIIRAIKAVVGGKKKSG